MAFKFNPFTGTLDLTESGAASVYWLDPVTDNTVLGTAADGAAKVTLDTSYIHVYDTNDGKWHNQVIQIGAVSGSSTANGVEINEVDAGDVTNFVLTLHPADSVNPGIVTTGAQNFAGNKTFDNDVIITGDLTVNGTTTTINTATLDVEDQNITINDNGNDASAEGAGLTVERTGTDGSLVYEDALASKWKAGALGSEIELVNISSTQTLTNKNLDGTSATGTNTITTDADQVTYERADGSKTDIQAASDDVESALSDLDDNKLQKLAGDFNEISFSLANNQAAPADVTGVAFANGTVRSAEIQYSIVISATAGLYESGKIMAVQRGADWQISQSTNGDVSQVNFSMTAAGQLQYTTPSYAGFTSGTLKARALTTNV